MALFAISDLTFRYPLAERAALQNVSFAIEPGEFILLCGKSGCGKSTLLRHFKTVLTPHGQRDGAILFQDELLEQIPERRQAAEIGYVLQNPDNQIVTDKVWHELAFGLESLGCTSEVIRLRVAEMASFFGIQDWFEKDVATLSGGQKQLLNLASVMVMQPNLLVLDEPTSQLDPIAAGEFLETLAKINRELGTTIFLSEQRLEEVLPLAQRVLVLEDGHLVADGAPGLVGHELFSHGNDMFCAMPSAMQIAAACNQEEETSYPVTVCEGRQWLSHHYGKEKLKITELAEKTTPFATTSAICVQEAWFRYEKNGPDVIRDLSFEVKKGQFYAIVGGNGTGKSTALSLITGQNIPYRGNIRLLGKNLKHYKKKELFSHCLAMLPQNPQALFVKKTVELDLWEMFQQSDLAQEQQEARISEIVDLLDISSLLLQHPYDLSGGEQQRVALAKVLLLEPEILLLDEPTKGLDGHFKKKLADIFMKLRQRGVTILMVSHDIEFCSRYADYCALFFCGSIVTTNRPRAFFAGNRFYTTAANRMSRHLFSNAVTIEDVIELCWKNNKS